MSRWSIDQFQEYDIFCHLVFFSGNLLFFYVSNKSSEFLCQLGYNRAIRSLTKLFKTAAITPKKSFKSDRSCNGMSAKFKISNLAVQPKTNHLDFKPLSQINISGSCIATVGEFCKLNQFETTLPSSKLPTQRSGTVQGHCTADLFMSPAFQNV